MVLREGSSSGKRIEGRKVRHGHRISAFRSTVPGLEAQTLVMPVRWIAKPRNQPLSIKPRRTVDQCSQHGLVCGLDDGKPQGGFPKERADGNFGLGASPVPFLSSLPAQ